MNCSCVQSSYVFDEVLKQRPRNADLLALLLPLSRPKYRMKSGTAKTSSNSGGSWLCFLNAASVSLCWSSGVSTGLPLMKRQMMENLRRTQCGESGVQWGVA